MLRTETFIHNCSEGCVCEARLYQIGDMKIVRVTIFRRDYPEATLEMMLSPEIARQIAEAADAKAWFTYD